MRLDEAADETVAALPTVTHADPNVDGPAPVATLAARARARCGSSAKRRASLRSTRKVANLSSPSKFSDSPTHSKVQITGAREERSAMRSVALDLAARKIAYCEVANGKVIERRTVSSLSRLEDLVGPGCPPARIAIEACREAWYVHAKLESWENQVLLVDTTRVQRLGVGQHGRKTDRIDAEVLAFGVERTRSRRRTCSRRSASNCACN